MAALRIFARGNLAPFLQSLRSLDRVVAAHPVPAVYQVHEQSLRVIFQRGSSRGSHSDAWLDQFYRETVRPARRAVDVSLILYDCAFASVASA